MNDIHSSLSIFHPSMKHQFKLGIKTTFIAKNPTYWVNWPLKVCNWFKKFHVETCVHEFIGAPNGFVCIIVVLFSWYYTAVLYNSLKPNEYYIVRMSPLRSPNESVSNGPLRSPNESDVESVEFRLQRIRGLLACYKV